MAKYGFGDVKVKPVKVIPECGQIVLRSVAQMNRWQMDDKRYHQRFSGQRRVDMVEF